MTKHKNKQKLLITAVLVLFATGAGFLLQTNNQAGKSEMIQEVKAQTYNIRAEHPRLILTPEKMEQVLAKVEANDPDWQSMYNVRYDYISGVFPYGAVNFSLRWALLYKITGEDIFLNRIREVLWDGGVIEGFNYQSRNGFRWAALEYIEIYDWLYYDWTAEEREDYKQHIITWYNYWRDYVDYNNNFADYRWSDSDETKSLARSFLAMGIVLYGDYEDALISLDIADKMWQYMEANWWHRMGGVMTEGCYYGPSTRRYVTEYLLLLKSGQGIGLSGYSDETLGMLKENVHYLLHSTSPDFMWTYPFGDVQEPGVYGMNRAAKKWVYFALELLEVLDGTQEAMYLRQWIDEVCELPLESGGGDTRIKEMLFNNRLAHRLSYRDFPTDKLFEKGRILLSRSSWDFSEDAVWWGFQYHTRFTDHIQEDVLSYQIMRGDDFVTKEVIGYAANAGRFHNTVLLKIDDNDYAGGGYTCFDGECELKSYTSTDDYTYINVDGSSAYSSFNNYYCRSTAETVIRKFLHLKPDLFVVFDIVKTRESFDDAAKAISNHFIHEPVIAGNIINSYEGDSRIFVKYLLPEISDLSITKIDETKLYSGLPKWVVPDSQKKWHTLVESNLNPSLVHFMHVIEVDDIGLTQMTGTELITSVGDNMVGAYIKHPTNGHKVAMFSKTEQNQTQATYTIPNTTQTIKHLILDLEPATYNVYQDGNQIITNQLVGETGTLYFTSQGASIFQITQGSFVAKPNITLTKTADKQEASQGDELIYTITYQNTGTAEAKNVIISDAIPSGTTYVSGGDRVESGVVYWDIPSLAVGEQGSVSFKTTVE